MRFDIAKSGSGLVYEIRHIVNVADRLKRSGVEVIWENIGDPVQKGEKVPAWMREVLSDLLREDRTYGYSPTKGMDATREFLAEMVNRRGKAQITPEDIIFFNGLGDAIARAYSAIRLDVADHHAGADLLHAPAGGGSPRLLSAEHLPDEPLLRLVSGYQRTGAEGEEPQGHRRDPRHQSRQSHRLRLSRGDAPADRGDRPDATTSSSSSTRPITTSSSTGRRPFPSPTSSAMSRGSA